MAKGNTVDDTKTRRILASVFAVFFVAIVGLVIAIIMHANKPDTDYNGIGLEGWDEIVREYETNPDYTINDAIADFKRNVNECGGASCRVKILLGYATFVFDHTSNVEEALSLLYRAEKDLDGIPLREKTDFCVSARDLMEKAGRSDQVERYEMLLNQYFEDVDFSVNTEGDE